MWTVKWKGWLQGFKKKSVCFKTRSKWCSKSVVRCVAAKAGEWSRKLPYAKDSQHRRAAWCWATTCKILMWKWMIQNGSLMWRRKWKKWSEVGTNSIDIEILTLHSREATHAQQGSKKNMDDHNMTERALITLRNQHEIIRYWWIWTQATSGNTI